MASLIKPYISRSDRQSISEVLHCERLAACWRFCISFDLTEDSIGDGLPLFDPVVFCNAATAGLRWVWRAHFVAWMMQVYHFDLWVFSSLGARSGWMIGEFLLLRSIQFARWMRGLIGGLATMEVLMLHHGRYLTPFAVCEFRRAYCVYRSALNCLADRACSLKLVRYHFRPKLHFLGHLVWHFLPANPRYYQNYSDEDFVARTKRIAERSHPGHMSRLTLLRYIIHACLRFSGETIWEIPIKLERYEA